MLSEFKLNSFVLDLSFISLLNQSIIDVTLCTLDSSFVFFCFLEVLFYSGYVLLCSINSMLSGFHRKIKLLFSGPGEHIHQQTSHVWPSCAKTPLLFPSLICFQPCATPYLLELLEVSQYMVMEYHSLSAPRKVGYMRTDFRHH